MPARAMELRAEFAEKPPDSVLVVKPSSLGDVVHALAPLAALRAHWPGTRVSWVVNPAWAPVIEGGGVADEIIPFPREQFRGFGGALRFLSWCRGLRGRRPDLVLDLQGLFRSYWIGRSARPGAMVGLSDAREGARLLTPFTADVSKATHAVDRYFAAVRELGVGIPERPRFPLPPGEPYPPAPCPFVVLHPLARGTGKSLGDQATLALIHALDPLPVVLVGRGTSPAPLPASVTDLVNRTTLAQLIGVLRQAAFTVSVDSGPMHLAAALSPRVLGLHGWSDPRRVGPYDREAGVWKAGRLWKVGDYDGTTGDALPGPSDVQPIADWVRARVSGGR